MNPIQKIKEEKNLTYQDFCNITGLSQSTIYKHLTGSKKEISKELFTAIKALGYDAEQVKQQYKEFKENKKLAVLDKANN